ncbi:MAG: DUF1097 domain-containing protein [Lentilactobacillus diolivorans]|jgi:hypothetical protein|nr:DUF1097 domain-containing protein [Lentilactobacillus diolivorans]MCH4164225.1 DUF1097 domain-containing protein [Lentilactobacillus diolivorans]MDH5104625.1 DUF1097 domain-containing protein [Lentilactobacillus diolivorans]RRG04422.1 MAG: DUF1097 domain-containing protein [Lactobacillus sp.]GEP22489.1 hypothetical protein LDI01_00820 [Lentilactobacillus diolivorans]
MKRVSKELWFSSVGVGLFTLFYSLIMSSFQLWMGAAAFISASYFFGIGCPDDKLWRIIGSFIMGIIWALISFQLLQIPLISQLWPSAIMFGLMTFLALFLQGTIMKFTIVPSWLIAWGTSMLIISNVAITNWPLFIVELFLSLLMGIFVIAYGSNIFSKVMFKLFPKKNPQKLVDHSVTDHEKSRETE